MNDINIHCINDRNLILNSVMLESMEWEERTNTIIFRSTRRDYIVTCRTSLEYGEYPVETEVFTGLIHKLFGVKL